MDNLNLQVPLNDTIITFLLSLDYWSLELYLKQLRQTEEFLQQFGYTNSIDMSDSNSEQDEMDYSELLDLNFDLDTSYTGGDGDFSSDFPATNLLYSSDAIDPTLAELDMEPTEGSQVAQPHL